MIARHLYLVIVNFKRFIFDWGLGLGKLIKVQGSIVLILEPIIVLKLGDPSKFLCRIWAFPCALQQIYLSPIKVPALLFTPLT